MPINAKIFMCTHKKADVIPPLCVPVQGGASLHSPIPGAISDDGPNGSISELNPYYCELTVQYYAWKNVSLDAYGFCHYRRFFCFDESVSAPYLTFGEIPEKKRESLLGNEDKINALIEENDVIVPRGEKIGMSVYEKYVSHKYCYKEDIDLFLSILKEKYPFLSEFADEYMSGDVQYFCNMFIMKRPFFLDYSEILFSILSELDAKKPLHGDFQSDRTDGYLGERFFGIYLLYLKSRGVKIHETARIDVSCSLSKRIANKLLPPETKRRFFFKKLFRSKK